MGGMGLIFIPVLVRHLLGPPGLSIGLSWTHSYTPNSPIGWYNPSPASHLPPPPPTPSCPPTPLYVQSVILQ